VCIQIEKYIEIHLIFKLTFNSIKNMANKAAKGFVLVTNLNPQPGNKHSDNTCLGSQVRIPIENIDTFRPFDEVRFNWCIKIVFS